MMNGWLKHPNDIPTIDSLNLLLRPSVKPRADLSSSTESLLTLLNVSIRNQQLNLTNSQEQKQNRSSIQNCVKQSVGENCVNNLSCNFFTGAGNSLNNSTEIKDYEFSCNMEEVFERENTQEPLSPKKKRKRNLEVVEDVHGEAEESSDCPTTSRNKKKKRKYSSSLDADEDVHSNIAKDLLMDKKIKKKKHKEAKYDYAENKTDPELKSSNKLNISNNPLSDNESIANEKIKRKKRKHSNPAETDGEYKKIKVKDKHQHLQLDEVASLNETTVHKKTKKKKHKKAREENQQEDLESIPISSNENITTDNESVVGKKRKKKKHDLSTLETDNEVVNSDVVEDLSIQKNVLSKKKKKKKREAMQEEELVSTNETMTTDMDKKVKKKKHKKLSDLVPENMYKEAKHHQDEHLEVTNSDVAEDLSINKDYTHKKIKKRKHVELESINSDSISENTATADSAVDKYIKKKKHKQLSELDPENKDNEIIQHHKQFQVTNSDVAEDLSIDKNVIHKINKKKHHKETMDKNSNNEHPGSSNNLSASENLNILIKIKNKHLNLLGTEHTESENLTIDNGSAVIEKIKKKKHNEEKQIRNVKQEPLSDSNSNLAEDLTRNRNLLHTKIKEEKQNKITSSKNIEMMDKTSVMDTTILQDMVIAVPWKIPLSHAIETRISAPPTKEQQAEFRNLEIKMKTGPYSQKEDQQIRDNWAEFCHSHDVDPKKPTLFMLAECKHRNMLSTEERVNFARYLGRGLENRTLYRIYQRFLLLYSTHRKGKFDADEDKIILEFVKHADKSRYSMIASVLNRHKDAVRKRYDYLKSTSNVTNSREDKFRWTTELMEDLVKHLLEVTNKDDVNDLKEISISTDQWKSINDKMGAPPTVLKRKWESCIYPQLFTNPEQVTLSEVQEQLINLLSELNETDRRNINWNELALNFDGMTGKRLNKIFVDLLKSYVPDRESISFPDSIVYLDRAIPSIRLNDRKLKRLQYINGKLVDY